MVRFKIKKRHIAAAAVDAAAAAAILTLTVAGNAIVKDQPYNQAASFWSDNKDCVQMSCFFEEGANFTTDRVLTVRGKMYEALESVSVVPEEGQELIADAYSTPIGSCSFTSPSSARADAKVTAVGGKFFLFRNFILLNGGYFSDDDLRQDGVVLTENLAWVLYGSTDIAGMTVTINDHDFYVSGVISEPTSKLDKKTAGEGYRAYITYSGASDLENSGSYSADASDPESDKTAQPAVTNKVKGVSCYECVMPSPVKDFAYTSFKNYFDQEYKDKYETVNNTERFDARELARAFRKRSDNVIRDKALILPYWENASRIAEYKLSSVYFWRKLCYIPLILTGLWIIVKLWMTARKYKPRVYSFIAEKINDTLYKISCKRQKKDEI